MPVPAPISVTTGNIDVLNGSNVLSGNLNGNSVGTHGVNDNQMDSIMGARDRANERRRLLLIVGGSVYVLTIIVIIFLIVKNQKPHA